MQNIKSNLYECFHCKGEGTCRTGKDGESCAACIKRNELKGKSYTGLVCGSCSGIGLAEPVTERMNKRVAPMLALGIFVSFMALIFWAVIIESPYFSQIIAFSGGILGSVIAFYFSGRSSGT